jgi:hypothetical protein
MSVIKDKLSILIAEKTQSLIKQIVPQVISIAEKTGIQNIGLPNEIMPDYCLINPELQKILIIRNRLVDTLNKTYNTINTLSKPLNILNTTINATSVSLKATSTARKAANVAISFIPPPASPPGIVISTINNLKDLEDFLNPKIVTVKNSINSITKALDLAKRTLKNLIDLLKSIDIYLIGCNVSGLTSLSDELQILDKTKLVKETPINEIYLGFILDIEVTPYTPTVNRRRAVAKNKDGIVLLHTPLSFTTLDQVLIEELKLIIDSNNLRAD